MSLGVEYSKKLLLNNKKIIKQTSKLQVKDFIFVTNNIVQNNYIHNNYIQNYVY